MGRNGLMTSGETPFLWVHFGPAFGILWSALSRRAHSLCSLHLVQPCILPPSPCDDCPSCTNRPNRRSLNRVAASHATTSIYSQHVGWLFQTFSAATPPSTFHLVVPFHELSSAGPHCGSTGPAVLSNTAVGSSFQTCDNVRRPRSGIPTLASVR